MDLTACHSCGCPLDFEKLSRFPEPDFWHDISGINSNLDRDTGKLRNCFVPRCAKPENRDAGPAKKPRGKAAKAFDVTCYVTVAVTVHGVKAKSEKRAAMDAALSLGKGPDLDRLLMKLFKDGPSDDWIVNGSRASVNAELPDDVVDGFLVQSADGGTVAKLDRNGEPV